LTREQIDEIVEAWQEALGLGTWHLKVDWDKPSGEDADATTWRSNQYDRATMHFSKDHVDWDADFANWIVVHELLHLVTREVDEMLKDVYDQLHRDVATQVERRYEQTIEGIVDRLARRIVMIGGTIGEADDEGEEGSPEGEVRGAEQELSHPGQVSRGERESESYTGG